MAIFLGGGGGRAESVELDRAFADSMADGPLAHWPFAMADERPASECEAWLRETFEPLGVTDIDTWPDLASRDISELAAAGGLYIGGGNTFRLLDELRRAGAQAALTAAASRMPIYGGSAGAAVLGATIETISHLDSNDVGITDLDAMDLLGGAAVWVHYEPDDDELIDRFLARHEARLLFVLRIDGGVVVDGRTVTSLGLSPSRLVGSVDLELAPGAAVEL